MLVQRTYAVDPGTRLPLVLVDTTQLGGKLPTEAEFKEALSELPQEDHVIILFASGSPKINFPWLQKSYKLFTRSVRKRIRKLYIVHENWVYKTLQKTVGNMISPKFVSKIVYIKSLTELAKHVDITVINISHNVYIHNLTVESEIVVPKHTLPVFGAPLPPEMSPLWKKCLAYLWEIDALGYKGSAKIFGRTGGSPYVWVLREAFDRNQLLQLSEYGPQLVLALMKLYLFELPKPLIPVKVLAEPFVADKNYVKAVLAKMDFSSRLHLESWLKWLHHIQNSWDITVNEVAQAIGPSLFALTDATPEISHNGCLFAHYLLVAPRLTEPPTPPPRPKPREKSIEKSVDKPVAGTHKVLKPKPSMQNIRGARVAKMAQFYENI